MKPAAEHALKKSIEHWEKLLAAKTQKDLANEGWGAFHCPLCALYHRLDKNNRFVVCTGCPIYERTNKSACVDSPYEEAADALAEFISPNNIRAEVNDYITPFPKEKVQAQVDFLRSLLP